METSVDGIEVDVQYSADKQLIVYHDWDIDALIGIEKRIENTPYSEIEKIRFNNEGSNYFDQ